MKEDVTVPGGDDERGWRSAGDRPDQRVDIRGVLAYLPAPGHDDQRDGHRISMPAPRGDVQFLRPMDRRPAYVQSHAVSGRL